MGAAGANVVLVKRDGDSAQISGTGQPIENVQILAINEFDSKRKCMSVVVRIAKRVSGSDTPSVGEGAGVDESQLEWGPPTLLCKGADSAVFSNCNKSRYYDICKVHVDDFACNGLRTLVMAQRVLSETEFESWHERYKVGSKSLANRKEMLQRCAEEIGEYFLLSFIDTIVDFISKFIDLSRSRFDVAGCCGY